MGNLIEIGLSGWIIFIISCLFGGGILIRQITKRKNRQIKIWAGGDVAGGNIIKGVKKEQDNNPMKVVSHSIQKDITADGDVAGGDIIKDEK